MRTPVKQVVAKITHILKYEDPDYIYLRDLFKKIRREFNIEVKTQTKQVPYIPTDEEIKYLESVGLKFENDSNEHELKEGQDIPFNKQV